MAKQMTYTDPNTGAVYQNSVWLPMAVLQDFTIPAIRVVWCGYKDKDAATLALKKALNMLTTEELKLVKGVIASKEYLLPKDKIGEYALSVVNNTMLLDAIAAKCYEFAEQTLDVKDPETGTFSAFFAAATDVSLL